MIRVSLKVVGAQGQGINSVGEMCAKGLKRAGYCVFGYREYMSLIKGGHSSYQLDVSDEPMLSSQTATDVLIAFNHHGLEKNIREVNERGIVIHQTPDWEFAEEDALFVAKKKITVLHLPTEEILGKIKAKPILGNVLITSVVWALLGQKKDVLEDLVREQFGHKKDLLALNIQCIEEGFVFAAKHKGALKAVLPAGKAAWKDHLLLTGSQAMGLGALHAGVRFYTGYPMTPSSPLLTFMADLQNETGIVIKQAEDEITAAQIVSGAMFMGTRALTGTSGGGFDLMSETLSLNGIIENPTVFILAQRPGPATGLPTWTSQGDLLLAVHTAHGEFVRCVLTVSDAQDAFDLMPVAFNLAEKYQITVIVLTDKQVAEALYTQTPYDLGKAKLDRGLLITDPKQLKKLKSSDRYDPAAKDGISPRWLPGVEAATFAAQGDEHDASGTAEESSANTKEQMEKRLKKMEALKRALPEPELFGAKNPEVLLVGWGSSKGPILDALHALNDPKIGYLHYTYLWPLHIDLFKKLHTKAKKAVLIEGNYQGQLGMLLAQGSGIVLADKILKYDGRPFFVDELLTKLKTIN